MSLEHQLSNFLTTHTKRKFPQTILNITNCKAPISYFFSFFLMLVIAYTLQWPMISTQICRCLPCCFSSFAFFNWEEFGAVPHPLNSGVLRNDNLPDKATASPTCQSSKKSLPWRGEAEGRKLLSLISLTLILKRAGNGTGPLPSTSQNLHPF